MSFIFCTFARNLRNTTMNQYHRYISVNYLLWSFSSAYLLMDGQEDPELAYFALNSVEQKENRPKAALITRFYGDDLPFCFGMCAVLLRWSMDEAFNNQLRLGRAPEDIVLRVGDFCFKYEAYIKIFDLYKEYLSCLKALYADWLGCHPKTAHRADDEEYIMSMIFFDEYEFYYSFLYTEFANRLTEEQLADFESYWTAFRNYMTLNYRISMPVSDIDEHLLYEFIQDGAIVLPDDMTLKEFRESEKVISIGKKKEKADKPKPEQKVIKQYVTMNFNGPVGTAIANVEHMDTTQDGK